MNFLIFPVFWYLIGLAAASYVCRPLIKDAKQREVILAFAIALFGPILWILIGLDKICDIWDDSDDKDYKQ